MTPAGRYRDGVTIVLTRRARTVGALLRSQDLDRAALFGHPVATDPDDRL